MTQCADRSEEKSRPQVTQWSHWMQLPWNQPFPLDAFIKWTNIFPDFKLVSVTFPPSCNWKHPNCYRNEDFDWFWFVQNHPANKQQSQELEHEFFSIQALFPLNCVSEAWQLALSEVFLAHGVKPSQESWACVEPCKDGYATDHSCEVAQTHSHLNSCKTDPQHCLSRCQRPPHLVARAREQPLLCSLGCYHSIWFSCLLDSLRSILV